MRIWQVSLGFLYATAVGVAFAGTAFALFLVEGLAITSVFQIWGKKLRQLKIQDSAIFSSISSDCSLFGVLRYHGEGEVFLLNP